MTSVFMRDTGTHTHTHRKDAVKRHAETGVRQTQAKACQEPQEAVRGQEEFLLEPQGNCGPAHTLNLNFWPPEL